MEAVARITELTAASSTSFQDAIDKAVARASKTLRNISGVEVVSQKAKVESGRITEYRATVNVTFLLDD
ncbi:hypothetical protein SAMN05216241_10718 [Limimonas halophila]|uniref:Dodecin domain-containing protein n=1 Tax=Limimonas halophila TaxID=1082479 RepID=A0A1G7SI58_9PROT|nr:dodecin family protein [Limimonas halophila]SDG22688.1 hypothetical protein SAMN05216241_10718 [Limimonas halophila]